MIYNDKCIYIELANSINKMTLKFFKKFVQKFLLQSPGTLNINKNKSQIFSNYKFLSLKKEDFDMNKIPKE